VECSLDPDVGTEASHETPIAALDERYAEMERSWAAVDLIVRDDLVTIDERDSGLTRLIFRDYPEVRFVPGWPKALLNAVLSEKDAKAENAA